jgi:hypothetical protein
MPDPIAASLTTWAAKQLAEQSLTAIRRRRQRENDSPAVRAALLEVVKQGTSEALIEAFPGGDTEHLEHVRSLLFERETAELPLIDGTYPADLPAAVAEWIAWIETSPGEDPDPTAIGPEHPFAIQLTVAILARIRREAVRGGGSLAPMWLDFQNATGLSKQDPTSREIEPLEAVYVSMYLKAAEKLEQEARFDDWASWTYNIIHGYPPEIRDSFFNQLDTIANYLGSLVHPLQGGTIKLAIENYCRVYRDLANHFFTYGYPDDRRPDMYVLMRKHKEQLWSEEQYLKFLNEYMFTSGLLVDYVFELTRAANLICDAIRREIEPSWRVNSARLAVSRTDRHLVIPSYSQEELQSGILYAGAAGFLEDRFSRDLHTVRNG